MSVLNRSLRVASLGLGDIAQKAYLPIICNHSSVTPILCTRDQTKLKSLADKYRVNEYYQDLDALVASKPDAVMVHSDTSSHRQIADILLNQNIPVFIDKPISYQLSHSEELLALAQHRQVPLFVGFNRRYAPLINAIEETNFTHVRLQKNRANIPSELRTFILDDFIHVVDTLLFLGKATQIEQLQVQTNWLGNELAALHVQWLAGGTSFHGSMNRICGVTEERLEAFGQLQKWQIDNLSDGLHYQDNKQNQLKFDDWQPTLYKRGFVSMLEQFLTVIKAQKVSDNYTQSVLTTHSLCERIVKVAERQRPQ